MLQYSGTVCVTLTLIFAMLLITWGIARGYRYLHNRLIRYAARKLQVCWVDTIDPLKTLVGVFTAGVTNEYENLPGE